jgi:hypothetical protein
VRVAANAVSVAATLGLPAGRRKPLPRFRHSFDQLTRDAIDNYKDLKTTGSIARFLLTKARDEPAAVAQLFLLKAARSWYGNESHAFERWIFVIQLPYLPFVVLGARELWRGNRQQRNFLLVVAATMLYFWAMTTFTGMPLLRYLVPAISLVMIVAAVAVDGLAIRRFPWPSSVGSRAAQP